MLAFQSVPRDHYWSTAYTIAASSNLSCSLRVNSYKLVLFHFNTAFIKSIACSRMGSKSLYLTAQKLCRDQSGPVIHASLYFRRPYDTKYAHEALGTKLLITEPVLYSTHGNGVCFPLMTPLAPQEVGQCNIVS
jgi:hypothetical protein